MLISVEPLRVIKGFMFSRLFSCSEVQTSKNSLNYEVLKLFGNPSGTAPQGSTDCLVWKPIFRAYKRTLPRNSTLYSHELYLNRDMNTVCLCE